MQFLTVSRCNENMELPGIRNEKEIVIIASQV